MGIFYSMPPYQVFAGNLTATLSVSGKVVVIDAGHGGWDPGKVGKNDTLEAHINLAITEDLQILLDLAGATVFLTRAQDMALADTKDADLSARAAMPTDMRADIFVSIHQNAFHAGNVSGAQAFYYEDSQESKQLAEAIQARLGSFLDPQNRKKAKADDNYYLLKKTETPAVIVECGFLTNEAEAGMLTREDYQEKVAWGIYLGILDYFSVEN
jgi:N-acetylmuramoyl-L-alanine amidase